MLLFELESNPLDIKLAATTSQLKSDIDSGKRSKEITTDELLKFYKGNDIIIDKSDLFDLIQTAPLNKIIANIQGDKVIFKGQETSQEVKPDENKKIVAKMAKQAMK